MAHLGGGRGGGLGVPGVVSDSVNSVCPSWWTHGCGCNGAFSACADCLEVVTPFAEMLGNAIWIFGSPLAFPIIFCFPSAPHTKESSGYDVAMLSTPCRTPCTWCFATLCLPCGQFWARRAVLKYDMTKYKLWQGYHDGPKCFARRCPGAPITIKSGTYGEQKCPNLFLCLEILLLGGVCSLCCAFDVTRRYQREEQGLNLDPTEARQRSCIGFFSKIMHQCFGCGVCLFCCSCLAGVCAPDSAGAQNFAGEGGRAARACCRIATIIWKGIMYVRIISIGCMTAQIIHEAAVPWDGNPKQRPDKMIHAPQANKMKDRGTDNQENETDEVPHEKAGQEVSDLKMPWEKRLHGSTAPQNNTMDRDAR